MGPRIPRKPGQPAKSKKHSDLYTDEDPKGTIHGLGFKTPDKAKESVSKIKKSSRSHNHKTQAAISMEQRAKVMGKSKAAGIYRKFIDSQKAKTKEMKEENELNEVSPPGFGHTKGDDKGGTAAAFDRARKEGRFKGSKSDMFAIMWSQKEKGDKPHYKPGTDKKYKKYQEGMENAPSIKDANAPHKKIKKTNVKHYPGLGYAPTIAERFDDLFDDPLAELWNLAEEMNVMPKPELASPMGDNLETPQRGDYEHPVTQKRKAVDALISQGSQPHDAHQEVHGELDTSDTQSRGKLAATFGRIQDDGMTTGVKIEKDKKSILARDAEVEKKLDQVTPNDLKTPMNQQVPDRDQTMADQVSEQLEIFDEIDYNDDVAYLQKFGRA